MGKHLDGCVKYSIAKRECETGTTVLDTIGSFFDTTIRLLIGIMNSDKLCEQVLRIITEGNLPFSFAENAEFVGLLRNMYPDLSAPNRHSVVKQLLADVIGAKEKLKAEFASLGSTKVSLAMDAWSTRTHIGFLGMSH